MTTIPRKGSSHLLGSLHTCQLKLQEDRQQQEKSVIAQPIFVFEKGEHTFKRPAEDTLYEVAEPERNGFSRKRVRSSSFTFHITDSQSQGVRKNNVFMISTLVQSNVDIKSAEQGPVKHSKHVIRPAILQLPQAQSCAKVRKTFGHKALESCKIKEKTNNKISEGNSYLSSENLSSARISVQLSTNQHFLGATSVECQPNEDKCSFKNCSSNFVFGENMVERVLSTQKLTQPQLENDSYAKEKPFKSTPKFPVNFLSSRTDSIKNTSLTESAAAFSSQPSRKCLLEKIDVITGEESEHNVLKINCKLFIFNNTTQSWIERGRGTLRLNDTASSDCGTLQSRLIMRNQGSLRLILNSKLWAQMKIQRANHKNVRITATDLEDYSIKVFLIQASAKDTAYLYAAIHHRLVALQSFSKQKDVNQAESLSETVQQSNCESCDENEDDFIQVTKNGSDPSRWTHRQSVACS
ncbi:ran-binding protein 3-like isoform X1 [Chlorocebus sabaeus]|uniref:Ran-binding protein 3-like n=1 Tax=Chlorocebus sabaeus TaxID=60711 RepID=A0A0D9RWS3_CHLSB|nr:ran-binding protein 3-like isoform X1 [Chlorocebus sabaeus]XP_007959572.1 ran-binding protein 3-like isoform X1 [Chlorocebus sabaeus]XP_007959573.1 ran-binding protein 3-like isoform X1 [Chlorocebus sabaeus]